MFAPEQGRRFLRWYDGEAGEPPVLPDQDPPSWLVDKHPWVTAPDRQDEQLIPLSEYNLKQRTSGTPDEEGYVPGPQAGDELVGLWRGIVDEEGFDSVAWYVPFHFSVDEYGIYVTERGIQVLGNLLFNWSHGQEKPTAADITFSSGDGEFPLQPDVRNAAPEYTFEPLESLQASNCCQ